MLCVIANRDEVECNLIFLGLLIMENTLKPQTTPVIAQLNKAKVRTVMATGDNILTALSVARQCGMVGQREKVVQIEARPPETGKPACISWEPVDIDGGAESADQSGGLQGVSVCVCTCMSIRLSLNVRVRVWFIQDIASGYHLESSIARVMFDGTVRFMLPIEYRRSIDVHVFQIMTINYRSILWRRRQLAHPVYYPKQTTLL